MGVGACEFVYMHIYQFICSEIMADFIIHHFKHVAINRNHFCNVHADQ